MDDLRIAKFETLIEDINSNIKKNVGFLGIMGAFKALQASSINMSLALIYDYEKLNNYAKVIMEKSRILLTAGDDRYTDPWAAKHTDTSEFKNSKACIDAAKDFVSYCRNSQNATEGYKFIFWALMILTVDKTDAEEHLSLICDFARMLRISDDELEDIVYVIKTIYNEVTTEYVFKTENIPSIFSSTFNLYQQN